MHMCTHVPADPKQVLALRITEATYNKYLALAGKTKLPLEELDGNVVIVPVDVDASWGWMDRKEFDNEYEAIEGWSKSRFTLCKKKG